MSERNQRPLTKFGVNISDFGEDAVWVNVVAWGNMALVASQIRKGENVGVMGKIKEREYNGQKYYDLKADWIGMPYPIPDMPEQKEKPASGRHAGIRRRHRRGLYLFSE